MTTELIDEAAALIDKQAEQIAALMDALKPFSFLAACSPNKPDGASVIVNVSRCRDAARTLATLGAQE